MNHLCRLVPPLHDRPAWISTVHVILSAFPPKDEQGTPASEMREAAEGSARVFCALCPDHTDRKTAPLLLKEFIAGSHMKSETPTTNIALQRGCTST